MRGHAKCASPRPTTLWAGRRHPLDHAYRMLATILPCYSSLQAISPCLDQSGLVPGLQGVGAGGEAACPTAWLRRFPRAPRLVGEPRVSRGLHPPSLATIFVRRHSQQLISPPDLLGAGSTGHGAFGAGAEATCPTACIRRPPLSSPPTERAQCIPCATGRLHG